MRQRWWRAGVAVGVLAGCGGEEVPDCVASIAVGTGVDDYVPVDDGGALTLVFGPQGGYHVPLALRGCGTSGAVHTHVTAERISDGLAFVDVTLDHGFAPVDACCGDLLDVKGYVFVDEPLFNVASLDAAEVRIEVTTETAAGELLEDAATVVLHTPD